MPPSLPHSAAGDEVGWDGVWWARYVGKNEVGYDLKGMGVEWDAQWDGSMIGIVGCGEACEERIAGVSRWRRSFGYKV